ncbi:TetR/AcrR family transcriptional regulator [Fodinicurvata sp. EGI_FJ10296]|uniref:TetR/AcrR family transcriptional regulator n=1 Tax=Fodinicurvata sp. EGI_FJ10296 TaxID=3231908 RepID=UPI003453AF70
MDAGRPRESHAALAPSRPAGGRTRRANEARILQAAEAVFAEAGFNGATMQAIAERAGLPKANVHYYFGTKEVLYRTLLDTILDMWVDAFDHFTPDADPATALERYIRDKMTWSRERPLASKVFANEIIHGAQHVEHYLSTKLRQTLDYRTGIIRQWIDDGRMAPVAPHHLFFTLWAMTQTYADFDVQIRHVLAVDALSDAEFDRATDHAIDFVLRGCGLDRAAPPKGG